MAKTIFGKKSHKKEVYFTGWDAFSRQHECPFVGATFYGETVTDAFTGCNCTCEDSSTLISLYRCFEGSDLFVAQSENGITYIISDPFCTICYYNPDIYEKGKYIAWIDKIPGESGIMENFKRYVCSFSPTSGSSHSQKLQKILHSGSILERIEIVPNLIYEVTTHNSMYIAIII